MITWHGRFGDYVRFEVMGYEISDADNVNDANWVRIGVSAQNEQGNWTRNCGCMVTWEIRHFSQWFSKVIDGIVDDTLSSYEPDLQFHYLATSEGIHRFAIRLSYGLGYESPTSERNTSLVIVGLSEAERQSTIAYFDNAERCYPRRGWLRNNPPSDLPEIKISF